MGRRGKPWYREDRDTWFATIDGRQVSLVKGAENRAAAEDRFVELKADGIKARKRKPAPVAAPAHVLSTGELGVMFLRACQRRVEDGDMEAITLKSYQRRLKTFWPACGAIPAPEIRPIDVTTWCEGRESWGKTSRHDAVAAVKAVFSWAAVQGVLSHDPLLKMKKPSRNERRELVMKVEAVPRFREAILSAEFADLVEFLYLTGARPIEACRLEAGQIDFERAVVVMRKGKTTKKTKRARVIYLTPELVAKCRRLALANPSGPIFRNAAGNPWNKDAINCQVRRIRERSGLGKEAIAYALRHIYVTDALERGEPIATVAELAGHTSPAMIARTYSHLGDRAEHLRAAANRIRPDATSPPEHRSDPSPPASRRRRGHGSA